MRIMEDKRPIKSITLEDGKYSGGYYSVGAENKITAIIPYEEYGEMGMVGWFQIVRDGIVIMRINGKFVMEITY